MGYMNTKLRKYVSVVKFHVEYFVMKYLLVHFINDFELISLNKKTCGALLTSEEQIFGFLNQFRNIGLAKSGVQN